MLKIFLCHSSGDKEHVRRLRTRLLSAGFQPWLDEEDILPGQDWDREIRRAIRASDLVLVCLSRASVTKTGYVQKEIGLVLDFADHQPEGTIYVIPARLEDCEVPERLQRWHRVDLFTEGGFSRLLRSLAAVGGSPVVPPVPPAPPAVGVVRSDGFYAMTDGSYGSSVTYTQLLRFYADGTAVSGTSTSAVPEEIVWWFHREGGILGAGPYEIDGDRISFATSNSYGTIEFSGTVVAEGAELHLHTLNLTNRYRTSGIWRFTPAQFTK
ncbi:toll/interleukin-1 receptor domain-containing protein [Streptomyces justiciae]|uniref:toll/interleukin-1 receptor domain-containing protein n=1 Tax=Streptomyces justiciae TaxID=2780140 RepID=UPI001881B8F8|nr:toll/interleukin-1 receptor domain-containing protein [Streptomyces justiciae]MBE8471360.1 toll/interleukin-1 receptor domain-containing protein [Streptomyces justiciae]